MANRYRQGANFSGVTRFTQAPLSEVEFSKMTVDPTWYVPFNGGDIVPAYYSEILPHSTFSIDLDYVCRQVSASLRPTMGKMQMDLYAFFVPNRVVNESWKNVQGENTSGYWSAPEVDLAPLVDEFATQPLYKMPTGSIADLYGIPTQAQIPKEVFQQMNDLKFRGYVSIYNEYFRDQNYQPPIPMSKLNICQQWLFDNTSNNITVEAGTPSDGSYPGGAIVKALYGEGTEASFDITFHSNEMSSAFGRNFRITDFPLKANKLHDAFTSVLPSPQKGPEVTFSASGVLPVEFKLTDTPTRFGRENDGPSNLRILTEGGQNVIYTTLPLFADASTGGTTDPNNWMVKAFDTGANVAPNAKLNIVGTNIAGDVNLENAFTMSVNDLRNSIATQQVLELLARGGSRYWSFLKSFFGVEADNPFPDIPTQIGHFRRDLDLYQVAQTSASESGNTPQGNLTAFGYTATGGTMFTKTFLEHGYIHILAVVRHRNIYSTYLAPDNFRRKTMDFYLPQLANISEQPIRLATLNPFIANSMERALGYQEAFWEYRYEPDRIHGILRTGVANSLDVWHYGDVYDSNFTHVNGDWLVSNTQEVLDRTLAVTSALSPQFIGMFNWKVTKQLPMPVYSVPGLDTI